MTTSTMASPILTHKYLSQPSSYTIRKPTIATLSCYSLSSNPKNFELLVRIPPLGLNNLAQWTGLRRLGISISHYAVKLEKRKRCGGKGVFASLFGVGAPEALVIGVVALLVFGPKGLAEVARNLGKTLREFQPTIRELQDVSREFKSTLEREIGLDEVQNPVQKNYSSSTMTTNSSPQTVDMSEEKSYSSSATNTDLITPDSIPQTVDASEDSEKKTEPNGSLSMNEASSSEDYLTGTEEQLKPVDIQEEKQTDAPEESQSQPQRPSQIQDTAGEAAAVLPPPQNTKSDS